MKRENYIDITKGLGIIFVVYAHVINNLKLGDLSVVSQIIYSFHMPLFLFVSGYCLGIKHESNQDNDLKCRIKKITLRLLVPYFVWSFVYMYIGALLENLERYKAVFTFRGIAPLWFLATLFMCELVFILINHFSRALSEKYRLLIFMAVALFSVVAGFLMHLLKSEFGLSTENPGVTGYYLYIAVSRFWISMALFICGFIFAKADIIKRIGRLFCLLSGFAAVALLIGVVLIGNLKVNLHIFEISNYWLFLLTSLLGAIGFMMISYALEAALKILVFVGQNSLGIMVLHYLPFKALYYSGRFAEAISSYDFLVSIIATVITFAFALLGVWLIKRGFFIFK